MNIYTQEEVLQATKEYFNGDDLAAEVWTSKYALRNEKDELLEKTPEDMHWRLAKEFARIEKKKFKNPLSEKEIFDLFDRFKRIIPQGSPMYGIGNQYQYVSIGNCFVIPSPYDSYLGIMYTDTQITQISCRRGGVGWDISSLRPSGMSVTNAAKTTSGCIEFMKRFSNTIREVGQNGRRGASLQSISVHHPDILKFIKVKRDKTQVTGSNITVQFTKEFFDALKKNEEYELRWPVKGKPIISKKIKASIVWNEFIIGARDYAEPGAAYWDTILEESTTYPYKEYGFEEVSSNPCQPGWATVLTPNGIRTINDVGVGDLIWSEDGWVQVLNKISSGKKDIYSYNTTFGSFIGTEEHKIIENDKKIEVKLAKGIDLIRGIKVNNLCLPKNEDGEILRNPSIIMDGIVFGDGSIHKASNNLVYLIIGDNDQDYFESEIKNLILKHRPGIKDKSYEVKTNITYNELPHTYLREIPERYFYGHYLDVCSFLRGLYSANGSITGGRITLKASSFKVIQQTQQMLSSVGIASYYTINKSKRVVFSNGQYECKQSYDLNITRDKKIFAERIGFIQKYKTEKLNKLLENKSFKKEIKTKNIVKIEKISNEEVFDIAVSGPSHTYWSGGLNVSNCGEQYLPPYASCRLILQNLYTYVKNKFKEDCYFDYDWFYQDAKIMQRLADDMVDLEIECIDKIITKIKNDPEPEYIKSIGISLWEKIKEISLKDRRTGCGFTALGDCLAALNIKYGSQKSIETAEKIQKTLKTACFESSVEMAKELGSFPLYNKTLDIKSKFIQRIKNENKELFNKMEKFGRRNMTLLTLAPAGTVSCETQTTSGIEPVFMLEYIRRKKGNPSDKNFKTDFVDQNGDHWTEFKINHKGLNDFINVTNKSIKDSPYYGCTAEEIDWVNRVKIQSVIQRHIDNSISTTINLPENISYEKVSEIYLKSYELGCKGCTVYRKNCRTGVLIENNKNKINKKDSPKRPNSLPCDIYICTSDKQKYFVIVGLLENDPYEVFAGKLKDFDVEHNSKGIIKKEKRGQYSLWQNDKCISKNIAGFLTDRDEAITRLLSASLRHGCSVEFLIHQLEKTSGPIHSFGKAVSRCLKKYINDDSKVYGEMCPNCKQDSLIRSEGCVRCQSCSYSRC